MSPSAVRQSTEEVRFVLACVCGDAAQARASFRKGFDLAEVSALALRHEVMGEVAATVSRAEIPLPAELLAAIRLYMLKQQEFQKALRRTTAALSVLFDAHSIDVLFAKGAVWNALYRPDSLLRTANDIDVYTTAESIPRACDVLRDAYGAIDHLPSAVSTRHLHHQGLWLPEEQLMVELHWAVAAPWHNLRFDIADALANTATIKLDGQAVKTLSPANAIVFGALELSKDSWASFKKILDFSAQIQAAEEAHIEFAIERAKKEESLRALCISFFVALELGLLEPTSAIWRLAYGERATGAAGRTCIQRLLEPDQARSFLKRARNGLLMTQKHDSFWKQLHHLWRIIVLYRVRGLMGRPYWER